MGSPAVRLRTLEKVNYAIKALSNAEATLQVRLQRLIQVVEDAAAENVSPPSRNLSGAHSYGHDVVGAPHHYPLTSLRKFHCIQALEPRSRS